MKFGAVLFILVTLFISHALASVSALETTLDGDTRYWVNAFSLASTEAAAVQDGGARLTTYNYVSLNYSTEQGTHWAVRLPFSYHTAGFDDFNQNEVQKQDLFLNDFLVDYTISSVLLPGEIEVFSRYRLELPTSSSANNQKRLGSLRFTAIASRYLTKDFQLEYWPDFTWNIHTQTVYENDFGTFSNTRKYELKQRLTLWYRANPKLFLGVYAGTEDEWFNRSEATQTSRSNFNRFAEHSLIAGPSIRYTLNRNLSFLFSLQNNVPISGFRPEDTGSASDLGRFRPEQTEFVLLSFINF
jgi:hypothetical protein